MDEYEFVTDVEVRYRDLDPMGHVNNAVYLTYLETARIRYLQAVLDGGLQAGSIVVANVDIDFRAPIRRNQDAVTVGVRPAEIGTTSVTLEYEIRAGDRTAAVAESTFVSYDADAGEPTPVPDDWRAAIGASDTR